MDDTTEPPQDLTHSIAGPGVRDDLALILVWSRDEPGRVGELLPIPAEPGAEWTFGRDGAGPEGRGGGLGLVRQRPGLREITGPLACPRISRRQLRLSVEAGGMLGVENLGRCPLLHAGRETTHAELVPGDVIELRHELVFVCARRPRSLPPLPADYPAPLHDFGEPDAFGFVGEGPAIWDLRFAVAALARRPAHVLVLGASGTGKELVARAIHAQSERAARPLIARSAATLPEGLLDVELFGHARNFPNPGTAERPGLVGEADGGTLFLDEFAELPESLQAHLLRVLDDGEYHRLGDARARRADLRLVAATNRTEQALKHDVLARLKARLSLPPLDARREDVPLLVAHLLRRQATGAPGLLARFFPEGDAHAPPRTTPELMTALVRHAYHTHLRELDALLLRASIESRGKYLELTDGVRRSLEASLAPREAPPTPRPGSPRELGAEDRRRLALQRKNQFNAAACGRDQEYGVSRQTADLHLRQLLSRALALGGWDVATAAAILAGDDRAQEGKVRGRIEAFLVNLRRRLDEEGSEALRRSLASEWRAGAASALALLDAMESGRLRGGWHGEA